MGVTGGKQVGEARQIDNADDASLVALTGNARCNPRRVLGARSLPARGGALDRFQTSATVRAGLSFFDYRRLGIEDTSINRDVRAISVAFRPLTTVVSTMDSFRSPQLPLKDRTGAKAGDWAGRVLLL